MIKLLPNGLRAFERCPRCAKPWADYSIFQCRNCESFFGACCEEERAYAENKHWLVAVCDEIRIKQCPICTAPVSHEDIIGVVVGRQRPSGEREEAP